ncbi:MAG: hypothetical protein PVI99_03840 [Anaerolineales bacterium]|jgi:hypothetical protein
MRRTSILIFILFASFILFVGCSANLPTVVDEANHIVTIRGRTIAVDRFIHGYLCKDQWEGTVYVTADIEVNAYDDPDNPTFLEGCDLQVAEGTVVYVAYHNDAKYMKGCSCHEP